MKKTKISLQISDMMCKGCEKNIRNALENLDGVVETSISLEHKSAEIAYNSDRTNQEEISKAIREAGYSVDSAKKILT